MYQQTTTTTTGLKIAFQNVDSINDRKADTLVGLICGGTYDIICLGELNKAYDFSRYDNVIQYHSDPNSPRVGILAARTLDLARVGTGFVANDLNRQGSARFPRCIQTYVYKIFSKRGDFHIEVAYIVPNCDKNSIDRFIEHIENQAKKHKRYIIGGDLNLNQKVKENKEIINRATSLSQLIKDYTRVRTVHFTKGKNKGKDRTSKTVIDLILVNNEANNLIKSNGVEVLWDGFDHYGVTCTLDCPPVAPFKIIKTALHPLQRPTPSPDTIKLMVNDYEQNPYIYDENSPRNYDAFIQHFKFFLDKWIPHHQQYEYEYKKVYRNPFPDDIIKKIKIKKKLFRSRNKSAKAMKKYKKMRNIVVNLTRKFKRTKADQHLKNAITAKDFEMTIKRLKNETTDTLLPSEENLNINGGVRDVLAKESALFYKGRAEDLTPAAGIRVIEPLGLDHLLPETFVFEKEEYDYQEITELIPEKKISKMSGPDGVAGFHLKMFWPQIQNILNKILNEDPHLFPAYLQGYYQRTIKKKPDAKLPKDLRPVGHNNPIPKYHHSKVFFKQLKEHLEPVFKEKKLFGYRGTHLCIIDTFDNIKRKINAGEFVLHMKYDFSNAFGTYDHQRFLQTVGQLNIDDDALIFLADFLENQSYASTIISDNVGHYLSEFIPMLRGAAQGQIGSDICFTIQQLELKTSLTDRNGYVDDLNDLASGKNSTEVCQSAIENERQLALQSEAIGFKLNGGKTEYINFNLPNEEFDNFRDIDKEYIRTKSVLLGVPFEATAKGADLIPAADAIICKLNLKAKSIHSCRELTKNVEVRSRAAKSLIFQCLNDLHLVLAYCKNDQFRKIEVKVNQLLRATGLERKTPVTELNKVLGTTLEEFASQGIIVNGLKILTNNLDPDQIEKEFDRTASLRQSFVPNTYRQAFKRRWNKLDILDRKKILQFKNFSQVKNFLKNKRKIKFDAKIFEKYKWKDYSKL